MVRWRRPHENLTFSLSQSYVAGAAGRASTSGSGPKNILLALSTPVTRTNSLIVTYIKMMTKSTS